MELYENLLGSLLPIEVSAQPQQALSSHGSPERLLRSSSTPAWKQSVPRSGTEP